jgi:ComF family protein
MNLAATILDLLYPRACACCGLPVPPDPLHICWDCRSSFDFINKAYCKLCGDPIEGVVEHEFLCSSCQDRRPRFRLARSAVRYRGPIRRALWAFKYEGATCLERDLTALLAACVRTHCPDVGFDAVVFVPLHPKRERERTYNQSRLLAAGLARELKVPFWGGSLKRVRPTMTQTDLSAAQRRANVRGAFEACELQWLDGRTLLLVDDVMTTGATVSECARVLSKAGAAGVYVFTVARG